MEVQICPSQSFFYRSFLFETPTMNVPNIDNQTKINYMNQIDYTNGQYHMDECMFQGMLQRRK